MLMPGPTHPNSIKHLRGDFRTQHDCNLTPVTAVSLWSGLGIEFYEFPDTCNTLHTSNIRYKS